MRAQELVGGGELGADARGVAARGLDRAVGLVARAARRFGGSVGLHERRAARLDLGAERGDARLRLAPCLLQRRDLALELGLLVAVQAPELGLELLDPLEPRLVGRVSGGVGLQRGDLHPPALDALDQGARCLAHALEAQLDAVACRPRSEGALGERLALVAARRQRRLGLLAPPRHLGQLAARLLARGPRGARSALGLGERGPPRAHLVACQLPARLERLALQALVQLGSLRLALERPQPRARLSLHVQCAVQVVLGALELQLRAATALAVLAQPRGLLDEHAPVARLGRHDRLDAPLRDDRVHLLAQAGVGEDLDDVDQPAPGAVEPVLAVAGAVEPAQDRDLAHRQLLAAAAVVEHELDLRRAARLHAAAAAEDDVLHRLAADRERRLLAERPEHRVGDVGLAGAVRADDHRDALAELQPRAVGERLEALQGDRFQMHQCLRSWVTCIAGRCQVPARRGRRAKVCPRHIEHRRVRRAGAWRRPECA